MNARPAFLLCFAIACQHEQPAPQPLSKPVAQGPADAADRTDKDRALDAGRHPAEMLSFLEVKPGMRVADLGAGPGYTTELLARAVSPGGAVYMQNDPSWLSFLKDGIAERFTHPAMKDVQRLDAPFADPLPGVTGLDLIVMNVIYHDIANTSVDRVRMNELIFNALKPGGAYVVIDSAAPEGSGVSATRTLHRIDEQVVRKEVAQAGFQLAGEGNFLRNPNDARDWNASPKAAEGAGKRGQSDRFALRFVRPADAPERLIHPALRLSPSLKPARVTVELSIDPSRDSFEGRETLELTGEATALLWLNATGLTILDTDPASTVIDGGHDFVGLQFRQPLSGSLKIHWKGKLPSDDNDGFFREQENGAWYAMTHLEPLGARRIFPSFDEPSFKQPWKISLRVPAGDVAYSNTPVESVEKAGAESVYHFAETLPLPSYLLAMIVGPWERTGKEVGVIVTHGKTAWAKYSAQSSPKLLDLLAQYFAVPYHYPKLDLFEVPLGTGAMENPGLISFNQRINLARPGQETPQFEQRCAAVEAHELAHLWFGDMVTTAWWNDIWLNEAFATWAQSKITDRYMPGWGEPAARVEATEAAMRNDRLLSARRIRQPIESIDDIENAFDGITYRKGAAVIAMFEQFAGPERFRNGVTSYLKTYADRNATAEQFLAGISRAAGRDIATPFSTFLDQPGLPLVTFRKTCDASGKAKLELAQSRYLAPGLKAPGESRWQIPVCVRTEAATTCTLLTEAAGVLDLPDCPRWFVPNAGATGYYRSALAEDSMPLAKLTVPERMRYFYDEGALARLGTVSEARVFEVIAQLAADKDQHLVGALLSYLAGIRDYDLVTDQRAFAAFVRKQFGARAAALGFVERRKEADDARILRPKLLDAVGDLGGDLALRTRAQQLALRWFSDRPSLSPELAETVLRLSAIDGDKALYDRYLAQARVEKDRQDRQRILAALGAFRDPELVAQGFAEFLGNNFEPREAFALVSGPAGYYGTRDAALAFVEKNFDAIVARMPHDFGAFVPGVFGRYCDDDHARALGEFFGPRARRFEGGERLLAQTVEDIRQCSAFREKAQPSLTGFLKK